MRRGRSLAAVKLRCDADAADIIADHVAADVDAHAGGFAADVFCC